MLFVVFFLFSFLAVSLVHCYLLISNFIFVSCFIPLCYSFSLLLNNFFYSSAFKLFLAFYIFLFCLFFPLCFHCLRSHYFLLLLFPVSIHFLYVQFISLLFLPFFFFHPLSLFLSHGMVNGRSESNVAAIQRATSFFQLISPKLLLFSMNCGEGRAIDEGCSSILSSLYGRFVVWENWFCRKCFDCR